MHWVYWNICLFWLYSFHIEEGFVRRHRATKHATITKTQTSANHPRSMQAFISRGKFSICLNVVRANQARLGSLSGRTKFHKEKQQEPGIERDWLLEPDANIECLLVAERHALRQDSNKVDTCTAPEVVKLSSGIHTNSVFCPLISQTKTRMI